MENIRVSGGQVCKPDSPAIIAIKQLVWNQWERSVNGVRFGSVGRSYVTRASRSFALTTTGPLTAPSATLVSPTVLSVAVGTVAHRPPRGAVRAELPHKTLSTTSYAGNDESHFRVFGKGVREITSHEETERPPEESARQIPACSRLPGTESPLEMWLSRSNHPRAGLAGAWTTRAQVRRVPADPTADRKPKACHTLSRNEKFEFFGAPSPGGRSVRKITSREETERLPENRLGRSTAPEQVWQAPGLREFQARRVPADPTADRKPRACQ